MPHPTYTQLGALLNLLVEPARLYDVHGQLVAQNQAARAIDWPDESADAHNYTRPPAVATIDLGEGWYLRRMIGTDTRLDPLSPVAGVPARPNLQALLGGITHELRNPLAAITTAASLLEEDSGLSEESIMLLGVVRKEARRMNQIMTEFSLYVRPPQPYPEAFDLAKIARRVVDEARRKGTMPADLTVKDELPPQLVVFADQNQIEQVLGRIVENAIEASPPQGALKLVGYTEDDHVFFGVEDNGEGFSEESLTRALLPFYSTKPQSTGLGLSTALVAVQAAGGTIWLENMADAVHETSAGSSEGTSEGAIKQSREGHQAHGARVFISLPGGMLTEE